MRRTKLQINYSPTHAGFANHSRGRPLQHAATFSLQHISMTTRPPSTDTDMPRFGICTWRMGENSSAAQSEIALIRAAIDMGATAAQPAIAWLLVQPEWLSFRKPLTSHA